MQLALAMLAGATGDAVATVKAAAAAAVARSGAWHAARKGTVAKTAEAVV